MAYSATAIDAAEVLVNGHITTLTASAAALAALSQKNSQAPAQVAAAVTEVKDALVDVATLAAALQAQIALATFA